MSPTCSVGEGVLGGEGEVLQLVDGCLVLLPHSQELLQWLLSVTNPHKSLVSTDLAQPVVEVDEALVCAAHHPVLAQTLDNLQPIRDQYCDNGPITA